MTCRIAGDAVELAGRLNEYANALVSVFESKRALEDVVGRFRFEPKEFFKLYCLSRVPARPGSAHPTRLLFRFEMVDFPLSMILEQVAVMQHGNCLRIK